MNEITVEQREQLKTWASQRDVLLSEISILRDEKLGLEKGIKEVSDSHTKVIYDTNVIEGRILELKKKEKEIELSIDVELAKKIVDKKVLENQIPLLEKQVVILESQKESLIKSIEIMQSVNSGFAVKNIELEKQIGSIIRLSEKNVSVVNSLMESLKLSSKELIDINIKNVKEANVVIDKLPRMVVELQKHGLIKKI